MKKLAYLVVCLLLFLSLNTSSQAIEKKKSDKYENWLKKEVKFLITSEEEKEFKSLKTDAEKDKFIELFWAKRDPSLQTRENEFKEEWYRRLEYVNKHFNYGSKRGINSDMGRVYMLLGPPAQTKGLAGGKRDTPMGGSQMEAPPQFWVYQSMPELGLNEHFRVTFKQYQFGYDLDDQTPQKILRAMEIFPKVVIFNPDIKELPKYKFHFDESSFEGKLIKDFISSSEEVEQVFFEWKPIFSRALDGSSYVFFLAEIDLNKSNIKKAEQFTFFGRMEGEGEEREDFLKSIKLEKKKEDRVLVQFGLPALPSQYTFYFGVRTKDKEKYTLLKSPLNVPDFWNDELDTGTIILSPKVVPASESDKKAAFDPYVFGQLRAIPRFNNIFKPSENLNVLFQIYNAQLVNDEASLKIEYFIVAPEGTYGLSAQEIKQKIEYEKAIMGGTEVPLSPLKPGKYTFKIKIIDKNAKKIIEKTSEFTVK